MRYQDRYDSLIQYYAESQGLDWKRVKLQVAAESSFNPKAVSPLGAKGLMQFMDPTWSEYGEGDPFNPEENIKAGCKYMAFLFSRFGEIPDEKERYRFALASYHAGRYNINRCLEEAREIAGQPKKYVDWVNAGRPSGPWQSFEFASRFLSLITGDNAKDTIYYIKRILPSEREL